MDNETPTGIGEEELSVDNTRSIFDLSIEELEFVLKTDTFPDNVNLKGIEESENFDRLFKYRNNPKMLAQLILKKRLGSRVMSEPSSLKQKRADLKEIELDLKKQKQESASFYQREILELLKTVKLQNEIILRHLLAMKDKK